MTTTCFCCPRNKCWICWIWACYGYIVPYKHLIVVYKVACLLCFTPSRALSGPISLLCPVPPTETAKHAQGNSDCSQTKSEDADHACSAISIVNREWRILPKQKKFHLFSWNAGKVAHMYNILVLYKLYTSELFILGFTVYRAIPY
jgi:hypothetical protein